MIPKDCCSKLVSKIVLGLFSVILLFQMHQVYADEELPIISIDFVSGKAKIETTRRALPWICLIVLGLGANFKSFGFIRKNLHENNNEKQMKFIGDFGSYMAKVPWASYYDVIGVLPLQNKFYHYIGSSQDGENEVASGIVLNAPPDVLVSSNRFRFFILP